MKQIVVGAPWVKSVVSLRRTLSEGYRGSPCSLTEKYFVIFSTHHSSSAAFSYCANRPATSLNLTRGSSRFPSSTPGCSYYFTMGAAIVSL